MYIKGFDELRKHLPELNSTGGRLLIALIGLGTFSLTTLYFIVSDHIPTWTIDSEIVVLAIGFMVFGLFFSARKAYIEKYKETAYRQAFLRFALPGLAILLATIAHIAYMSGPYASDIERLPGYLIPAMTILGWYWIIVGAVLWIRSAQSFGVDYLTMLYVYMPENGRINTSSIYGILRHPIYAAALRIGIGLALLNTSIFALSFIPFFLLGFSGWIWLVEEKELLERFPEYAGYRRKVPAFWVRPQDIGRFWKFLVYGG